MHIVSSFLRKGGGVTRRPVYYSSASGFTLASLAWLHQSCGFIMTQR
jgi:hypothetical protein